MARGALARPCLVLALAASAGCGVTIEAPTPEVDGGGGAVSADLDVAGRWNSCARTLTFLPGGDATRRDDTRPCVETGRWTVHGTALDATWSAECGATETHWVGVRTEHLLVLLDLATNQTTTYADDTVPHATWALRATDGTDRASVVRVIGTPDAIVSGCYWSADHACNGLFSCGGYVSAWALDGTTLRGTTGCNGSCPCTATFEATGDDMAGYAGTFQASNCERTFGGALTATPVP